MRAFARVGRYWTTALSLFTVILLVWNLQRGRMFLAIVNLIAVSINAITTNIWLRVEARAIEMERGGIPDRVGKQPIGKS